MFETFTPIQSIAACGILGNRDSLPALGVSDRLISLAASFSGQGISGLSQSCVNQCGPNVQAAIREMPAFLTGIAAPGQRNRIPVGIEIDSNNIVGAVLTQAQGYLQHGQLGLLETIQTVQGFVQSSFTALASVKKSASVNLVNKELGHIFKSVEDLATGGISNQFGDVGALAYRELCANIRSFGDLFASTNLTQAFTPVSLVRNLIKNGFYEIISAPLVRQGISIDKIDSADPAAIMTALDMVGRTQLQNIFSQTDFTPPGLDKITKMSDVFVPNIILGTNAQTIAANLEVLGDKISTVLGNSPIASSWIDIADVMLSIAPTNSGQLAGLAGDINTWQRTLSTDAMQDVVGRGNGIFGNPTFGDVLGTLVGDGYTDQIQAIQDAHSDLLKTNAGIGLRQALQSALAQAGTEAADVSTAEAIRTAYRAVMAVNDPALISRFNIANQYIEDIFDRLIKEKLNLRSARVDLTETRADVSNVVAFVQDLHFAHDDANELGYARFINMDSTTNIYGEAVRAAIVEGANLNKLQSIGVQPRTSANIEEFTAQQQLQRQSSLQGCCP